MENCDHLFFKKNCDDCPYIDINDFFEDRLLLCASTNFKKDSVKEKEIKELPLIIREKDSSAYNLLNNFFAEIGLDISDLNISLIKRKDYQLNKHEENFYNFILSI